MVFYGIHALLLTVNTPCALYSYLTESDMHCRCPINLSHESCIRHEQRDCAILTLFFVLLHSLCYKTNILLIYNYELHAFLFSKSVLDRESCLFSLEHEERVLPQDIKTSLHVLLNFCCPIIE